MLLMGHATCSMTPLMSSNLPYLCLVLVLTATKKLFENMGLHIQLDKSSSTCVDFGFGFGRLSCFFGDLNSSVPSRIWYLLVPPAIRNLERNLGDRISYSIREHLKNLQKIARACTWISRKQWPGHLLIWRCTFNLALRCHLLLELGKKNLNAKSACRFQPLNIKYFDRHNVSSLATPNSLRPAAFRNLKSISADRHSVFWHLSHILWRNVPRFWTPNPLTGTAFPDTEHQIL